MQYICSIVSKGGGFSALPPEKLANRSLKACKVRGMFKGFSL
jgi:hypothetical protein